jgi:hypothetical protein
MPVEQRLQKPAKALLAWVAQVMPSVKVGFNEVQERIRDIREFFQPITSVVSLCGYFFIHIHAPHRAQIQYLQNPPRKGRRRSEEVENSIVSLLPTESRFIPRQSLGLRSPYRASSLGLC